MSRVIEEIRNGQKCPDELDDVGAPRIALGGLQNDGRVWVAVAARRLMMIGVAGVAGMLPVLSVRVLVRVNLPVMAVGVRVMLMRVAGRVLVMLRAVERVRSPKGTGDHQHIQRHVHDPRG